MTTAGGRYLHNPQITATPEPDFSVAPSLITDPVEGGLSIMGFVYQKKTRIDLDKLVAETPKLMKAIR